MATNQYRLQAFVGLLSLVISITACDRPARQVAQQDETQESAAEVVGSAAGPERSSERQPPVVDPDALNAAGEIMLTAPDEVAGPGEASTGEVASTGEAATGETATATGEAVVGQDPVEATADIIVSLPRPADAVEGTPTLAATSNKRPDGSAIPAELDKPAEPAAPVAPGLVSPEEMQQVIGEDWPTPQFVLYVSGQQHGYIEPCGCTGLDRQKGGLIRRDTLLTEIRAKGWPVVPVDVGNQVRRIGRQPEIKFQRTARAFELMGYEAATLGVDDLKLSSVELLSAAGSNSPDEATFISANVVVFDPSLFPGYRIVEAGGRKLGITAVLGKEFQDEVKNSDIEFFDPVERLKPVVAELKGAGCDFLVLLAHASLPESREIAKAVPEFDVVVTGGGFGEPTLHPEEIDGTKSIMVQVGVKGMYGGLIGVFDDAETPLRYQRIAITAQYQDSPRMLEEFAAYQEQLKSIGLEGLGVLPASHPTGRKYVGSEACGDCHTTAFEIWENSPHVHATDSIVAANNERGGIPRHFDPECIACHVTGWNQEYYYPYDTGYLSLEQSAHLVTSGCENCHGPGKDHVDAEYGDIEVDNDRLLELRQQMVLKLDQAQDKCMECHDLDNSPDFHVEGAFEEYWEQVKHYGKD